jgi:CheY-like chemotaxis protein
MIALPRPAVLVLDADAATFDLLREWLGEAGFAVCALIEPLTGTPTVARVARCAERTAGFHLVIIDVPYPRALRTDPHRRLAALAGDVPVLALSATFHSSVECCGEVARSLGVAGALAKPLQRDALVRAVLHLSRPPPPWTPPTH